jgi:predicted secreted acid phosphatase
MWKLYGVTDEGIAIRVSKKKLEKLKHGNSDYLNDMNAEVLMSNVIYVSEEAGEMKNLVNNNLTKKQWLKFRNLLLKHKAYQFEEEFRMSVILPEGLNEYPLGIKLTIGDNLNDFIDSVYLNPLIHSTHWYIKVVQKMLEVFKINEDKLKLGEIRTSLR